MNHQRFAVEFDRRVVGIAVRVPGGFMFFASNDLFEELDGRLFPRARAIARALQKVGKRKAPLGPQDAARAGSQVAQRHADAILSGVAA